MASKNKKKELVLPNNYIHHVNDDGLVIVNMDFFTGMCPSKLNDTWASLTLKFRPWFEPYAVDKNTGRVNENHGCKKNVLANRTPWLQTVQNDILGKKYRDVMIMGWNEGLYQISEREKSGLAKSVGRVKYSGEKDQKSLLDHKIDFSFRGKTPTTQEDVKNILFGDEVTKMVLDGSFEEPMALLFKWGYYLTMEGCSLDWATTATEKYIHEQGYKIILGEECDGDQKMTLHGWKRYGKKNASNSFQTILRKKTKTNMELCLREQFKPWNGEGCKREGRF